ncbi:MAG: hypothetical protein OXR66_04285 [Candidatus Woesearchaeota archaeon]|nr:hypothetical protein [Candidatus Woesearchaeota archaeon]
MTEDLERLLDIGRTLEKLERATKAARQKLPEALDAVLEGYPLAKWAKSKELGSLLYFARIEEALKGDGVFVIDPEAEFPILSGDDPSRSLGIYGWHPKLTISRGKVYIESQLDGTPAYMTLMSELRGNHREVTLVEQPSPLVLDESAFASRHIGGYAHEVLRGNAAGAGWRRLKNEAGRFNQMTPQQQGQRSSERRIERGESPRPDGPYTREPQPPLTALQFFEQHVPGI